MGDGARRVVTGGRAAPPPAVGLATRCARGSAPCRRQRHGAGGPAGGRAARESGRREPGRPERVRRPRSGHVPARAPQPASCGTRVSRLALAAPPARSSSADAPWGGPEVSERTRGRGVRLSLRGPGARLGRLPNPHSEPRPGLCAGDPPGLGAPGCSDWDAGPGWGAARAGMPARWAGGGCGPSRCWGRGAAGPMSWWEGVAAGPGEWAAVAGDAVRKAPQSSRWCGAGAGRPARSALRRGLPPGKAGRRRPGRRERRRVALAETEERAPEAWARGQTARSFRSSLLQRAGSSEAFRARDEYRPTAIVICSWLNIFYLKRRWGCMGGGV